MQTRKRSEGSGTKKKLASFVETRKDEIKDKIRIPFNKPFVAGKELYYIAQAVMKESHLSGNGPFTQRCHEWLVNKLGCTRAFLTHSGTAALEMAAILCDIQPGDEVIMPSFTFVSTANAFVLRGAVPVFVDIRPDTLTMDEREIEQAISSKTRAIVAVHYAGVSCDMDEVMAIADHRGLWVIEDAAHAFLSTYKGKFLGTIGHLGCLSFHETKNIISGEGGALLVNDSQFIERAEIVWEKGTDRSKYFRGEVEEYTWVDIGSSFLPGDLVGAFLYAQLEQGEAIVTKRRRIFERYYQSFQSLEKNGLIGLPFMGDHCARNGNLFYIITRSLEERTELIQDLLSKGILAVFHYVPLHSSPAGKKYGQANGEMRVTDDLSSRLLRLPLYYEMTDGEVEKVVDAVTSFYGKKG